QLGSWSLQPRTSTRSLVTEQSKDKQPIRSFSHPFVAYEHNTCGKSASLKGSTSRKKLIRIGVSANRSYFYIIFRNSQRYSLLLVGLPKIKACLTLFL